MSSPAFNDADLADVAKLTKLRSLALNTYHLTPKGLAGLKNPELRSICDSAITCDSHRTTSASCLALPLEEFESHAGMTDDALLEFAIFPNLKRIPPPANDT